MIERLAKYEFLFNYELIIFASSRNNIFTHWETSIFEIKYQNIFKMKKLALIFVFAGLFVNMSCGWTGNKDKENLVQIGTEFGIIKIKLYDETPQHSDNFMKLISEGFYTDLLFHRVIKGFMVQGGDPDSKNAEPGKMLGSGDLGYTIPPEINPKFFHRRGVLAAARQGDQVNPEKRSSASQFYILQGKVFRAGELDSLQTKMEEARKMTMMQTSVKAAEAELNKLSSEGNQVELMARLNAIRETVAAEAAKLPPLQFSEEQRKVYTTLGGYPSLDNNYTIFGEVTEGMEVIDKIAQQPVNTNNRPVTDIKFSITFME